MPHMKQPAAREALAAFRLKRRERYADEERAVEAARKHVDGREDWIAEVEDALDRRTA